ncbi:hypothetical protein [Agrobacterium rosae]|uniref:hypothetical protein n=1 Tax=Agrobacterium rosae TaxID=1972867 RepID=UPI000CD8DCA3|nr:hypothetical protein [Agrobacterium rosae]POO48561.1 hypothetical protein CTT39_24440 [Agrobacterium rosae]
MAQADNAGIADLSIGYQVVAQMINPLEPDPGSIQFKPVGYASGSVRIWQIIAQGACTHLPVGRYPHGINDVSSRIDLSTTKVDSTSITMLIAR